MGMKSKSCCNPDRPPRATKGRWLFLSSLIVAWDLACVPRAAAGGKAPQWMRALVNAPLPSYDEKTDAVLLYSEINVTVVSTDKIKTQVREAYKILRPNGRDHGIVFVHFNPQRKIRSRHGWCSQAQGKGYEVRDKDAIEVSPRIDGAELVSDVKYKVLRIPASDPGNIVGYEYEVEEHPFFLQDTWSFQKLVPVQESHYYLQLPAGWEYKASWLNHPEVNPTQAGSNQFKWSVTNIKGIRREPEMPPRDGVAGAMIVSFFPPGGAVLNGFANWDAMGNWYTSLVSGRTDASLPIKQEVATLIASKITSLQKMQALAEFVQRDIRYVAIELGIGGWQPHPATDVFAHRYGDCKDKATLLRSMLQEIGINTYQVAIYTERGAITPLTPAHHGFNHAIIAIQLPESLTDPSLI